MEYELYHHGVKGMKWGHRKNNYHSTGLKSALAKRQNNKVDESFNKWKENAQKRDNAINLGKKATDSRLAYENNRKDKNLKKQYKQDNKAYKKALSGNTTYRKGQVRKKVGSDLSRKYLSQAKKIQKQMVQDPSNKQLRKQYNDLMSKHDVARAKARKAPQVAENRSKRKANFKRTMTMSVKAAAGTATVAAGAYAINRYLSGHNVTLNGNSVYVSKENLSNLANLAKKAKKFMDYVY